MCVRNMKDMKKEVLTVAGCPGYWVQRKDFFKGSTLSKPFLSLPKETALQALGGRGFAEHLQSAAVER